MRLATFNAENLFSRPKVMQYPDWADGRQALEDFTALSRLIEETVYTAAIKARLITLLNRQLYSAAPPAGRAIKLNEVRGKLVSRAKGQTRIVPSGRPDWVGWFELVREDLSGKEVNNTGRVIDAVRPDVLCLVEVEDRLSMNRFNDQVLQFEFLYPFRSNMLVDGNDVRGIDIGLFSQLPIGAVRSFTDLPTPGKMEPVFSRDCPMFDVLLPDGRRLIVLGNHFKSQGYGNKAANDARRLAQATAVAGIYEDARLRSDLVAVCGDLNAGPDDASIATLVQGTDLRDVMQHPSYAGQPGALPGTFGTGKALKQKFDYVLLSPALWQAVQLAGVERRGVWAPNTFPHFPEVTGKVNQASDHACVWVDLAI